MSGWPEEAEFVYGDLVEKHTGKARWHGRVHDRDRGVLARDTLQKDTSVSGPMNTSHEQE